MSLTLEDALRAYAKALNTLNPAPLEPILAVDFHYSSQMVFQEITSRDTFLDYFRVKLQAIEKSKATVFAEMGKMPEYFRYEPCVVVAQHGKDNLVGVALGEVESNQLKRLDFCIAPCPSSATRTGDYPK